MKRKWLKVVMLAMMAGASFGSPMNPKEIEDLLYVMNQTRIEFTVPDEDDNGEGGKTRTHQEMNHHSKERRTLGNLSEILLDWAFEQLKAAGLPVWGSAKPSNKCESSNTDSGYST